MTQKYPSACGVLFFIPPTGITCRELTASLGYDLSSWGGPNSVINQRLRQLEGEGKAARVKECRNGGRALDYWYRLNAPAVRPEGDT